MEKKSSSRSTAQGGASLRVEGRREVVRWGRGRGWWWWGEWGDRGGEGRGAEARGHMGGCRVGGGGVGGQSWVGHVGVEGRLVG